LIWWGQRPLAIWLNVPPAAVSLSAFMLLLATVRPVVAGMLQGQHRFVAFGFTRSAYAVGRFVIGAVLISLGGGLLGAIAALPLGATLALLAGLAFLGRTIWRPGPALPVSFRQSGSYLSGAAFVAYVAYMSLLSSDLIWVNRAFTAEMAGGYATAVLLRRILALLPGAVIVIMYPRAVVQIAQRKVPDKLLAQTAIVVLAPTLLLTFIYFLFGSFIVRWTFGPLYAAAAPLLGWMGLAMLGYGFTAIWLNFYLATRPTPFVALLALTAILHFVLLAGYHETLPAVTALFALGGWLPALEGLLLYLLWLRPRLVSLTVRAA
jgi:O-antigen/teichoic acid export membrane protein